MPIKPDKSALSMLESPWLRQHVGGHIVFGPLSQGGVVLWSLFLAAGILIEILVEGFPKLSAGNISSALNIIYASVIIYIFYRMPSYHRAAILWCVIKFVLFLLTFIMFVAGGLVGFFRGNQDAIHITILAILWVPGLEFVPKLVEKQKMITLGKLLISIPIVFLWYKTGTWH